MVRSVTQKDAVLNHAFLLTGEDRGQAGIRQIPCAVPPVLLIERRGIVLGNKAKIAAEDRRRVDGHLEANTPKEWELAAPPIVRTDGDEGVLGVESVTAEIKVG
jgi:hypothetical protein